MAETRTFKRYNFVTGVVDGTLAYDFGNPAFYPEEEEAYEVPEEPRRKPRANRREQVWVREEAQEEAQPAVRRALRFPVFTALGAAAAVVLFVMLLLAQVRLVSISDEAVEEEATISILKAEHDKLTVEYETIFNLKDVEEYAVGVLGMQEPQEDQIHYLSGVAAADKSVIITQEETDMLSLGLEDLLESVQEYFR